MKGKYLKKLSASLSILLILIAIGTFVAGKANADTPFPTGSINATYDSSTGQLSASGNYTWNLCVPGNKKKWVGYALFINGAFPSSAAPDSRVLDGTGMHLANGGNACETDPGSWSDTHTLTSAPTSVCVVIYDVEINTVAPPNVGDRSETGAGKDFNEDNSYHNNSDSYATGDCTVPTVISTPTPTPTPTNTPSNPGGPGDGRSDGKSDGRSDGRSSGGQVLGASTGVLGLAATSGNSLVQILPAFVALLSGAYLLRKNA